MELRVIDDEGEVEMIHLRGFFVACLIGFCVVVGVAVAAEAPKASAVETVIPMADPDGVWRVSGYAIR